MTGSTLAPENLCGDSEMRPLWEIGNASSPLPLIAAIIWILIGLATLGRGTLLYHSPRHIGAYPLFIEVGRHFLDGEPLYSVGEHSGEFRYSPSVAVLFAVLPHLPGPLGSALLRMASYAAFVGGVWRWGKAALPLKLGPNALAALLLLALPLSFSAMLDVQTTGLAVGLLLLGTADFLEGKYWRCALALVWATLIKAYPVSLLGVMLLLFPRRLLLPVITITVVSFALPFLMQRPQYVASQYSQWIHFGLDFRQRAGIQHVYRDIRTLLHFAHLDIDTKTYMAVEISVGAAIAALLLLEKRRGSSWPALLVSAVGLTTCWMTVFGPATESQTYIFVAASLAWACLESFSPRGFLPVRVLSILSLMIFTLTQLGPALNIAGKFLHNYSPHALAGLLLFIGLVVRSLRAPAGILFDDRRGT